MKKKEMGGIFSKISGKERKLLLVHDFLAWIDSVLNWNRSKSVTGGFYQKLN